MTYTNRVSFAHAPVMCLLNKSWFRYFGNRKFPCTELIIAIIDTHESLHTGGFSQRFSAREIGFGKNTFSTETTNCIEGIRRARLGDDFNGVKMEKVGQVSVLE